MNRKKKMLGAMIFSLAAVFAFPTWAYANSSWRWISETRPYDILPVIVIVTLAIEIAGIYFIGRTDNLKRLCVLVTIANILSFAAPYLAQIIFPSVIYTFEQMLEHTPFYTVGIVYLAMSLLVEVPLVYFKMKAKVPMSNAKLFWTIIGVNIVTTVIAAIAKRLICYGVW